MLLTTSFLVLPQKTAEIAHLQSKVEKFHRKTNGATNFTTVANYFEALRAELGASIFKVQLPSSVDGDPQSTEASPNK